MQEVWKNHESATLGKIASGGFRASCVDTTPSFVFEVAPLGLPALNNSAKLGSRGSSGRRLRDMLSPGGSSEWTCDARQVRSLCGSSKFLVFANQVNCSIATGDRWRRFHPRHDRGHALWRHRLSRLCIQSPALSQSFQQSQR